MSAIKELPTGKDYGLGFNYSVWTAGTSVTLANVPWNSDYRDIVRFDSQSALDTYIQRNSGPVVEITKLSYAKFGRPIRLDTPFDTVQEHNYLRVSNPLQPISGSKARVFYYFITDVVYINPNCTEVYIQLDVWQTFGYTTKFGNCYIERGHVGIANENQMHDHGREFLTAQEGLDVGGEYEITETWSRQLASARNRSGYAILLTTTGAITDNPGTVEAPIFQTARGSKFGNLPNGAETYIFNHVDSFMMFMEKWSDKPWVTQAIISIMAVPNGRYEGMETETTVLDNGVVITRVTGGILKPVKTELKQNWRDHVDLTARYQHLNKFKTYPYMVLEITSYAGTPVMIKPESWADHDATVVEVAHFAQPAPRLMFYPFRYNAAGNSAVVEDEHGVVYDGGEFMDMATGITNFPTFSLVNNGYLSYMASNQSGIAFQHQSADWSQQRALQGAQTSYDQANAGIGTTNSLSQQGIDNNTASAHLAMQGQMMRGGIGAISGAAGRMGNPVGMAGAVAGQAANTAVDLAQTSQQLANQNSYAAGTNRTITGNMGYMRDTNKSLAEFSSNGDYANAIAGINAKTQDAKLTQPTTSGQVGGDAFNLATYKWGYDIKVKQLQAAARNTVGEIWLRYGYAINRFGWMPENFHVMEKFTYWKLKETYIIASACPESFKQIIRGIFEKGVTVWRNPDDIGTIDIADNMPLPGIRI